MIDQTLTARLLEDIGPAGLRAVVAAFRGDLARLLAALEQACSADDTAAFARAAHGLAGAAGTIGAIELERACRAAMAAGTPATLPTLLAAVQASAAPTERAVLKLLAAPGQPG
jgi:HPt (histidine-containing phosphotransfer) domain-containing protein